MDIRNLVCKYEDEKRERENYYTKQIKSLEKKLCTKETQYNRMKSKYCRRNKRVKRMNKYFGQYRIVNLQADVETMDIKKRDSLIKKYISRIGGSTSSFIVRQLDLLYQKNEVIKEKVINKGYADVISKVNASRRTKELSDEHSEKFVSLKICCGLSHSRNYILRNGLVWEEYTDENGKLCKKKIVDENGLIETFGCSRYMLDKGTNIIKKKYEPFVYNNIYNGEDGGSVFYSSLIALVLIYFTVWSVAPDFSDDFMLSEKNIMKRFGSQIEGLTGDERLNLDFGRWRSLDGIDGTPLKNVSFGGGSNWLWWCPALFINGTARTLTGIHHAFSNIKDTNIITRRFNNSILECDLKLMATEGIIFSYPNIPVDATMRLDSKFLGDMPLVASIKEAQPCTSDYGEILDTVIMTRDENSLKTDNWKYNLTPTWMYKYDFENMRKYPRMDDWREVDFESLPNVFKCHLEFDIHEYVNDKIDAYILSHEEYGDINDIDDRKAVSHIFQTPIFNRCNQRAIFFHFEWLHGSTTITSTISQHIIDEERNTMKLSNEDIITGCALVGHSSFKKQVSSALKTTSKDKKCPIHLNGNISKTTINTLPRKFEYLMPKADTKRELLMLIAYLLIICNLAMVFWIALCGISQGENNLNVYLDEMQTRIDGVINGLVTFSRIQKFTPYLKRLSEEAVPQMRLYTNDELNIHVRGGESLSLQLLEHKQSEVKQVFARHMNKKDEKLGIQTCFLYLHIRNCLGVKHGIWKLNSSSSALEWRAEDLEDHSNPAIYKFSEHLEMTQNTTMTDLFNIVKQTMKTGVVPQCYKSQMEQKVDIDESDDENNMESDETHVINDGLCVRSPNELIAHLDNNDSDSDSDSDSDFDPDFV